MNTQFCAHTIIEFWNLCIRIFFFYTLVELPLANAKETMKSQWENIGEGRFNSDDNGMNNSFHFGVRICAILYEDNGS